MGQLCVWLAPSVAVALWGAALTGAGFSLVFPAFGVEAVKRVDAENRGAAPGAYVAFFDLSMGMAAPLAGWVATSFGYAEVYLLGAVTAFAALLLAASLRARRSVNEPCAGHQAR